MGLPSYKINNSYTVYVNYYYLNDCIKAGKKDDKKKEEAKKFFAQQKTTVNSQNAKANHSPAPVQTSKAVKFGTTVQIINIDTKQICTWTLVHPDNIDLAKQTLSVSSPVGKALIGRRVGDCVSIKIPTGIANYRILELVN
jgi:transcription elongation factor GreA